MAKLSQRDIDKLDLCLSSARLTIKDILRKCESTHVSGLSAETEASNIPLFLSKLSKLDDFYERYEEAQEKIRDYIVKLDKVQSDEFEADIANATKIEELYFQSLSIAKKLNISDPKPPVPSPNDPFNSSINAELRAESVAPKLPKIPLPKFDGKNLSDWPHFYETFKSLVHRKAIPNIDKFHYLKESLSGPALSIIKPTAFIGANYEIAWNALVDRFDNKRVLANDYLSKILKFKINANQSLSGLLSFLEEFYESTAALKQMSIADLSDFILVSLALRSLDNKTRTQFESENPNEEFPTLDKLIKFIKKQCRILELSNSDKDYSYKSSQKSSSTSRKVLMSTKEQNDSSSNNINPLCPYCKSYHKLNQCTSFLKLTPSERHNIIKSLKRCFNCFGSHLITNCGSKRKCSRCSRKHNTLLHFEAPFQTQSQTQPQFQSQTQNTVISDPSPQVVASTSDIIPNSLSLSGIQAPLDKVNTLKVQSSNSPTILLATAQVLMQDVSGSFQSVRLVVDSGSQLSFISESCVKRLNLPRKKYRIPVEGLGESSVPSTNGIVSVYIHSRLPSQPSLKAHAVILSKISSDLPSSPVPLSILNKFSNKFLADPHFAEPGPIEFLLGMDLWPQIFPSGNIEILSGEPSACLTIFGWLVMGKVPDNINNLNKSPISLFSSNSLESALKKFWEVEEPLPSVCDLTSLTDPDDIKCEQQFMNTHYRTAEGQYVVQLPFKTESLYFGDTHNTALNRFQRLESRLSKNLNLKLDYTASINDFLNSNYMEEASSPGSYIIPHHCVIREHSATTKVRIVFDASTCTPPYQSLNQCLYKGPKLQRDITHIIISFRTHEFTLCADIKQMFLQVLVDPSHRKYLHILWRDNPEDILKEYELKTVTFGVTVSPYLAMRALRQLVIDEGADFPLASSALNNDILMDDVITGTSSLEEALKLKSQLIELLRRGGFCLRKWMSNEPKLLENIPESDKLPLISLSDNDQNSLKILGIQWDPISDHFCFKINISEVKFTKRGLLSMVASVYDPLGWLSPVIFLLKHLIQKLWLSKYSWDEHLPSEDINIWQNVIKQLPSVSSIQIPRYILTSYPYMCSIIGFCDASEKGYGCILYLRCENSVQVKINLIKSKTKVAPLKLLSIPRLELCGAVLLADTLNSIQPLIDKVHIDNIYLFTDSSIVLNWLQTPPHLLKTFVGHRVVKILNLTGSCNWSHIRTELNPADCCSKGILPDNLITHSLWWTGPSFLMSPLNEWPVSEFELLREGDLPEIKSIQVQSSLLSSTSNSVLEEFIDWTTKFSSLYKLQKCLALILRFSSNCRNLVRKEPSKLISGNSVRIFELEGALFKLIKLYQEKYFSKELQAIRSGSEDYNISLKKLAPFLDGSGILRVGGRIQNSLLTSESKHPILLPKTCHLTLLIIDYFHHCFLHVGPRTLQAILSQRFWILCARNIIRHRIRQCLTCFRFSSSPLQPFMSNLPPARVQPSKPFLKVGCDFGGPILVKEHKRRNPKLTKAYFCIYVCMSTRAVHLEAVSDLSTDAFLACLERFVSRRGACIEIVSDCGTNFCGAAHHLKDLYKFFKEEENQKKLNQFKFLNNLQTSFNWKFNCPSAPHFNGLSEAGIKSTKHHLRRIMGNHTFTLEELSTVLCKIEAILNSRPLCPLSSDPKENNCLTPGHFLVGDSLVSLPQEDFVDTPSNRLSKWQLLQQITQTFWRRWSSEYLHTLQTRSKWTDNMSTLAVGDLVLIIEPRTSPLTWPMGVVQCLHPGEDKVVRVATIRTKRGTYRRPLVKLILVPKSI